MPHHHHYLFIFRLHSEYEEDTADDVGVPLYASYVEACNNRNSPVQSSQYIGKVLATAFPDVHAKRCRSETDWTKYKRRYIGLKSREQFNDGRFNSVDLTAVSGLRDMFVMEQCTEHIIIGYKTNHSVIIEVKWYQNLKIEIKVGTKIDWCTWLWYMASTSFSVWS